jgi:hypothetical protein
LTNLTSTKAPNWELGLACDAYTGLTDASGGGVGKLFFVSTLEETSEFMNFFSFSSS